MTPLLHSLVDLLLLAVSGLTITGIGVLVLRTARVSCASRGQQWFFAAAAGCGVAGYAVFIPSVLGVLYPSVIWGVLALLACASLAGWRSAGKRGASPDDRPARPGPARVEQGAALCLAVLLLLAVALALAPETGKDALAYHLALPRRFLQDHGFRFHPGNAFSNSPLHAEMLYLPVLFVRGEVLAKLLHFGALLGVLGGMWHFSLRHVGENEFPYISLLVFTGIPTVFAVSHTAYVDLFVTLYAFAAFFAFANWSEEKRLGWLGLAGFFTGLALSCKYTALILPFLGVFGILWVSRQRGMERQVVGNLLVYACATVVFGAPFYIKNLVLTGNPFYPFLYRLFGGRGWDPEQARMYEAFVEHLGMGRRLQDYLLLPWNLSLRAAADSPRFDGIIGPVFLFTLPLLAGMRRIAPALKWSLAFCLLWVLFWASSAQQARFLVPVFPFLSLSVGTVLSRCRSFPRQLAFGAMAAVVAGCLVFAGYHVLGDFRTVKPLGVIAGTETRTDFLARLIPSYPMYRFADTNLPSGSKVFLIYMRNYTYLCRTECYSDSIFESYTIQKILSAAASPEDVLRELRGRGFTHMMYDSRYIFEERSLFTREEKDLFSRFQEKYLVPLRQDGAFHLLAITEGR